MSDKERVVKAMEKGLSTPNSEDKNWEALKEYDVVEFPEHYNKGEIDLIEAWSRIYPENEFRAGMQMMTMRYLFRDKVDKIEDLNKAKEFIDRQIEFEHKLMEDEK